MTSAPSVPGPEGRLLEGDTMDLPLDSELLELQRVKATLEDRTYKAHRLEAFDREIVERFGEIGWKVDVKWHETNVAGTYIPVVELVGRCERKEFDHDQMAHEVRQNILNIPGEHDVPLIKGSALSPEALAHRAKKGNHKSHKEGSGCC